MLFGESDNVVSLDGCKSVFAQSSSVNLQTYQNAHHGFDNDSFATPVEYRFGTIGYDAAAAQAAWAALSAFLQR